MDRWISRSMDQWICRSMDQWINGSVDRWISRSMDNLNCRLVKQKSQKPYALACYKHLQLSVHSSNRMTSSILWELSAGFRSRASTHNHKVVIPCPSSSVILSQKSSSCSRRNTNAVSVLLTGY